jgi:hypothetical protein
MGKNQAMNTIEILTEWAKVVNAATPVPGSTSRGLPSKNEEMLLLTARTAMPRLIAALRVAIALLEDVERSERVYGYDSKANAAMTCLRKVHKVLENKEQTK